MASHADNRTMASSVSAAEADQTMINARDEAVTMGEHCADAKKAADKARPHLDKILEKVRMRFSAIWQWLNNIDIVTSRSDS